MDSERSWRSYIPACIIGFLVGACIGVMCWVRFYDLITVAICVAVMAGCCYYFYVNRNAIKEPFIR
jgi:uncharacterized membrane protein YoaK (UPF0700 family)